MDKFVIEIAKALEIISKSLHGLSKKVGKFSRPTAAKKAAIRDSKPGRGPAPKKTVAAPRASKTIPDQVLEAIKRARKGINIEGIQGKTGLSAQQVNNALAKLVKAGSVSRVGRGVYTVATGAGGTGAAAKGKKAPKAAPKAKAKAKAPAKGPKAKAAAPVPETPKAKAKASKKAVKPAAPMAASKIAQVAPKAPRKPRRTKATEPVVVEQPSVEQEPQVQMQEQAEVKVPPVDTQATNTEE